MQLKLSQSIFGQISIDVISRIPRWSHTMVGCDDDGGLLLRKGTELPDCMIEFFAPLKLWWLKNLKINVGTYG